MPILLSCISALFNAAFALQLFDACKRLSLSLSHSNKSSWLIPPQAQGVLLFKAQSVFSPFHPSEEAELTSADPHSQRPSQLQPASHSFSQSLIHCSFFWVLKSKTLHLNSALAHSPSLCLFMTWVGKKSRGSTFTLTLTSFTCVAQGYGLKKKKTDCLVILNIYCITETSATVSFGLKLSVVAALQTF